MLRQIVDRKLGYCPISAALCALVLLVAWPGCVQVQGLDHELIRAARNGNAVGVQDLLNKGADVNAKDERMNTALAWAVLGDHNTCATLLLEAGANINIESFRGLSPLHLAIINGNHKMAKLLLANGADVNAEDNYQSTALMNAINLGDFALVQILVESGADQNAKNYLGQTSLIIAEKLGHTEIAQQLKSFGVTTTTAVVTGRIRKTDEGIVLTVDNGDTYVVMGKDLYGMIGQIVKVTGTMAEGISGKTLTVTSVELTQE